MRSQHAGQHPSDRLSSGAVHDFAMALYLVDGALDHEMALLPRSAHAQPDREAMARGHTRIKHPLGHAGRVWQEEQEAARVRTVERLRGDALAAEAALDDEASRWLGLLAEALDDGDYSRLAI